MLIPSFNAACIPRHINMILLDKWKFLFRLIYSHRVAFFEHFLFIDIFLGTYILLKVWRDLSQNGQCATRENIRTVEEEMSTHPLPSPTVVAKFAHAEDHTIKTSRILKMVTFIFVCTLQTFPELFIQSQVGKRHAHHELRVSMCNLLFLYEMRKPLKHGQTYCINLADISRIFPNILI